jgi:hypothetical protein
VAINLTSKRGNKGNTCRFRKYRMRIVNQVVNPGESGNWSASEIVFYSIYSLETKITQSTKDKLNSVYNEVFGKESNFKLNVSHWTYENCQGILLSLNYFETEFDNLWINNLIDKNQLEKQLLKLLRLQFEQTKPILSCICEWPNDIDFLEESFATMTISIISEFNPQIISTVDYNKLEWVNIFKALKVDCENKYGKMGN